MNSTIKTGDLDHDGRPDIVVAGSDSVTFRLATGPLTFGPEQTLPGTRPIALGDLDGDGNLDVVSSSPSPLGGLFVSRGRGDGTFQPAVFTNLAELAPDPNPFELAVGDLNGDGRADVVVEGWYSGPYGLGFFVSTYLSNGDGSLTLENPSLGGGWTEDFVYLGDVDGDGQLDVVYVADAQVAVVLRYPGGGYRPLIHLANSLRPLAVLDVDGIGRAQIVFDGNWGDLDVATISGETVSYRYTAEYGAVWSADPADFDGDGRVDLALISGSTVRILRATGNPSSPYQTVMSQDFSPAGDAFSDGAVADFNGDGKPDLVYAGSSGPYPGNGSAVFLPNATGSGSFGIAAPADFCRSSAVTATAPDFGPGTTYQWSIAGGQLLTDGTGASVQFQPGGLYGEPDVSTYLSVAIQPPSCPAVSGTQLIATAPLTWGGIAAPAGVCLDSSGNVASVPDLGPGWTYYWFADNATITSGQDAREITFSIGHPWPPASSATLSCGVSSPSGCYWTYSKQVPLRPVATFSLPAPICPGGVGSVTADEGAPGVTYLWSIQDGEIVSGQGTQAVTYTASSPGSHPLRLDVTYADGCTGVSIQDASVIAPFAQQIYASPTACAGSTGNVAYVRDDPPSTISWEIDNGVITSGLGTNRITYTAGASGAVTLRCRVVEGVPSCESRLAHTVSITPGPAVEITVPTPVCDYNTITATASDAGVGARYDWAVTGATLVSAAGRTVTFQTGSAGGSVVLSVTVTNDQQCQSVVSRTLNVIAGPNADITVPLYLCSDDRPIASVPDAGPGAVYVWSLTGGTIVSGAGTRSITVAPGSGPQVSYQVDVTNAAGCTVRRTWTSYVYPTPSATISAPATLCSGETFTASVPDAGPGARYSWSINGGAPDIRTYPFIVTNAWLTGSMTVSVTVVHAQGCRNSSTVTIPINPYPVVDFAVPATVCPGKTVTATSTTQNPGPDATYSWRVDWGTITSGAGTPSITVAPTGQYSVAIYLTVTTAAGCSGTSLHIVTIANPTVDISMPASLCTGSTANFASVPDAGPGATYGWTVSNGVVTGGAGTPTVTFTAGSTGSLGLAVAIQKPDGCVPSGSKTVPVYAAPDATITAPSALCPGQRATASVAADPSATYLWTVTNGWISDPYAASMTVTAGPAGPVGLSVTVTRSGCSSSGTRSIAVSQTPSAAISAPGWVCDGGSDTASVPDAGPGATYAWSAEAATITGGLGTPSITFQVGSVGVPTFSVTVTNAAGCSTGGSRSVPLAPLPQATITAPSALCAGSSGAASVPAGGPGATYSWTITNGTVTGGAGTPNVTFTAGASGPLTLAVTVLTSSGCSASGNRTVTIDVPASASITAPAVACVGGTHAASVPNAAVGSVYQWSITNGSITSGPYSRNITFQASGGGPVGLSVTITTGTCVVAGSLSIPIESASSAAITSAASVCAGSTGNTASVADAGAGSTYTWTITNGTITGGASSRAIDYTAGASGPVSLQASVQTAAGCVDTRAANVDVNPLPSTSFTFSFPSGICPNSTHTISVPDAGAYATYTWTLTNGTVISGAGSSQIWFTAAPSGPLTVGVAVRRASGCTASGTMQIPIVPLQSATITGPASVCPGAQNVVASVPDGGPQTTYVWTVTNGTIVSGQTERVLVFNAGTSGVTRLDVTVWNSIGCYNDGSRSVSITPAPIATITAPAAICASAGGYTASVADAGAGATYAWSITNGTLTGGAGTRSVTFASSATGDVQLGVTVQTGAGCASSGARTAVVNAPPSATIAGPAATCPSSTGNVATVANAGAGAAYTWTITNGTITGGAGTPSIAFTAGASGAVGLSVTVQTAQGCSSSGSQNVAISALPSATITAPAAACAGSSNAASVPDDGVGATYTWTIANGTITSGAGTRSIAFTAGASGAVSLGVTVRSSAGCQSSGATNVPINAAPSAAITAAGAVCAGSTANSASVPSAGTGATYAWTITGGTITSGAGTRTVAYTAGAGSSVVLGVTVQSAAGCAASGTQTVTVNPRPSAAITAPSSIKKNTNGSASVPSAGTGATYAWTISNGTITGGAGTSSITFRSGSRGTMTLGVTVTSSSGCVTSGSMNVTVTN